MILAVRFPTFSISGYYAVPSALPFESYEVRFHQLGLTFRNDIDTVQAQYTRGQLRIATWAHLVNCSLISGTSIIPALASAASSTLSSINQSVSTEISVGTPRTSAELNDAVHDYPFPSSDAESSGKGKSAISGSLLEELEEPQRRGSVVHATTTISQKIERSLRSTSSLARAVSVGEGDETDREEALLALGEPPQDRGLLLLSEMSSEGNLMGKDYTAQCVEAARENNGFVIGHVAQRGLNEDLEKDNFVVLTPGVGLPKAGQKEDKFGKGDGLGQKYRTPEVVVKMGTDIIIVGRGILTAEDWAVEAERYRKAAWTAYESRVGRGDF